MHNLYPEHEGKVPAFDGHQFGHLGTVIGPYTEIPSAKQKCSSIDAPPVSRCKVVTLIKGQLPTP